MADTVSVRIVTTTAELEHCHMLRRVVFVEEQSVSAEEEWDDLDDVSTHFLAFHDDEPVGTARLFVTAERKAKAQRVAVLANTRKLGVGRALMDALEDEARTRDLPDVVLGAQLSAVPFYQRLGYEAFGPEFDDAGIPHRMMKKAL